MQTESFWEIHLSFSQSCGKASGEPHHHWIGSPTAQSWPNLSIHGTLWGEVSRKFTSLLGLPKWPTWTNSFYICIVQIQNNRHYPKWPKVAQHGTKLPCIHSQRFNLQAAVSEVEIRQLYINGVEPGSEKREREVNFSKALSSHLFIVIVKLPNPIKSLEI